MKRLLIALGLCLIAAGAIAQPAPSPTPQQTVATMPNITTYQGTMTLSAGVSTPLTAANVTMAPHASGPASALPYTFNRLTVVNTGNNPMLVCWFGGSAGAATGCETIGGPYGSDTVSLNNSQTPPTFYSAAGTTVAFHN